jgi:transposase
VGGRGCERDGTAVGAAVLAQGETVLDVPAKLAARVRVFDTGNARKTDATDAHAVAMVALRTPRLNELSYDEELVALRLLADRRDELSHLRVQTVNRLQRLLTELIPGGAKRDLSALQAKRLLATVKPRTLTGKTMRRMAASSKGRRSPTSSSSMRSSRPSRRSFVPQYGPAGRT